MPRTGVWRSAARGGCSTSTCNACARAAGAHGNIKLHADQLVLGLLLAFFEPMARSLRARSKAAATSAAAASTCRAWPARRPLTPWPPSIRAACGRRSRTCAPAARACHTPMPTWRASRGGSSPPTARTSRRWPTSPGHFATPSARDGRTQGQVRANVQLDVGTWVPQVVSVSGGDDGESEPAAFAKDLLEGVLYVVDRNFVDFSFIAAAARWPGTTTWCCGSRPTSPPRR